MSTTERVWTRDFNNLAGALLPYVVEIEGEQFIGENAPAEVVEMYEQVRLVGYANGWFVNWPLSPRSAPPAD